MTFGNYRGVDIRDVPVEYLEWLLETNRKTTVAIEAELNRRQQLEDSSESMLDLIIKTGFRELSKRFHPDAGGDQNRMRELNGANEELKELLSKLKEFRT